MAALNRIVHPALINAIRERIRSSQRVMNRLVLDAALIVELGFATEHRDGISTTVRFRRTEKARELLQAKGLIS